MNPKLLFQQCVATCTAHLHRLPNAVHVAHQSHRSYSSWCQQPQPTHATALRLLHRGHSCLGLLTHIFARHHSLNSSKSIVPPASSSMLAHSSAIWAPVRNQIRAAVANSRIVHKISVHSELTLTTHRVFGAGLTMACVKSATPSSLMRASNSAMASASSGCKPASGSFR